jgi:TPR repeat protein
VDQIIGGIAAGACANDKGGPRNQARSVYQHGRALMASGNLSAARRDFEAAIARGYRTAQIDLAMLLSRPSAKMLDLSRAISLYEHAWRDGVTNAAFELGRLYEDGVGGDGARRDPRLSPDEGQAWFWYQKAADSNEPNALARVAEKESVAASSAESAAQKNSHLLKSFKYYAAAAEVARNEDWPDDAWRDWRYRRASLARLLEREGMMQEVADAYLTVRNQHVPPPPPRIWERLRSLFGMQN